MSQFQLRESVRPDQATSRFFKFFLCKRGRGSFSSRFIIATISDEGWGEDFAINISVVPFMDAPNPEMLSRSI
jgi:hypothetical protein